MEVFNSLKGQVIDYAKDLETADWMQISIVTAVGFYLWWFASRMDSSGKPLADRTNVHGTNRGIGPEMIWWVLEHPKTSGLYGFSFSVVIILCQFLNSGSVNWRHVAFASFWPVFCMFWPWVYLMYRSRLEPSKLVPEKLRKLVKYNEYFKRAYGDYQVPISDFYMAYISEDIELGESIENPGKQATLDEVLLYRYELFRFVCTMQDFKYFIVDTVGFLCCHGHGADSRDVGDVYDMGNDFYGWFLDTPMLYSSGIWRGEDESLEVVQNRKLDTICKWTHMQKGDRHLDLGCGWGTVVSYAAKHFGTQSVGVTLSKEQAKFARKRKEEYGVAKQVDIRVMNAWDLPIEEKYKRITCLEMAEHVGIRYFQEFMNFIRERLDDDGIFYLQIAGLRRTWQYEDLIWGLFMMMYIFPGADASMPIGWVTTQLERAGFEVHRVENMGVHYGLTINAWHKRWLQNKPQIKKIYPERLWRIWDVFLAWSTKIALQGSSTVFMITLTKNTLGDARTFPKGKDAPKLDRTSYWVGPDAIEGQQ